MPGTAIWTTDGLLDHVTDVDRRMEDRSFAFILGAGASRPSGIPTGGELVSRWLKELQRREDPEADTHAVEDWACPDNLGIESFEYSRAAEFYPQVYEHRFEHDPEEGFAYLEDVMNGKEPSVGYSVLAQILANTRHRVVITTNFDNLVADSLYTYTRTYPLVCGHESLVGFVRPRLRRPLVAKIHRDLLLAPKSDLQGTAELAPGWDSALTLLFKHYTPIVLGYGGNDGSFMGWLEKLEPGTVTGGIWWCYRRQDGIPDERIQALIAKHKGKLVPILGFDEFMLQLGERFDLGLLTEPLEQQHRARMSRYRKQVEDIQKRLQQPAVGSTDQKATEEVRRALAATIEQEKDWWAWELKARGESDLDARQAIYRQGLEQFPDSAELTGNFANFMADERKDYDRAEALYEKALQLDPDHANNTGNFALFMKNVRKDYDRAEALYEKALQLDPDNAANTGNFANFMKNVRKDYDRAEALYEKALQLDPDHANNTGNFASFMADVRKDYDRAEALYEKALQLDPDHANNTGNFASFMAGERKDYDRAEALYEKALQLDPDNAANTGNFANFMKNVRKDYDRAEALYEKALQLDPDHANNTGNFASFMADVRKDYDRAEALYEKALQLDPDHANNTGNFASFMAGERKDYDRAEALYEKALQLDPDNAAHTGNFANFLADVRKDYDRAEALYEKALQLDPDHANNTGNFALFMKNERKDYDRAEALYEKALQLDPDNAARTGNFASFMADERKDYDRAEALYEKALQLDPDHAAHTGNFASFLLAQRNFDRAGSLTKRAWQLNEAACNQLAGEITLYRGLLNRIENQDDQPALGRLKTILAQGFQRDDWSFDDVLARVSENLSLDDQNLYKALAAAILDPDEVAKLDQFKRWKAVKLITLDTPWDEAV